MRSPVRVRVLPIRLTTCRGTIDPVRVDERIEDMKPPLFVRPLTPEEHQALRDGLRSPSASTLRRCQILSASAHGRRPAAIAEALGCAVQTVRDAIRAFHAEGVPCLQRKTTRPHTTRLVLDPVADQRLRAL